jgi:UDP-GlcNAc:undecaprenyl-phosphate/decaprenyl-phosphate GlcNAc-1-phosphate transferase
VNLGNREGRFPPRINTEGRGIAGCPWWATLVVLGLACGLLVPSLRLTWQSAGGRWVYIFLLSGLISFGLTPLVIRLAYALGVFDFPASRKVHTEPTPLLGGLAIYIAFGISILANSILDQQVVAILVGGSLLVTMGVLDDVRSLPAGVRLLAQLLAVAVVIRSGVVLTLFGLSALGNVLDATLPILWLLGITNAMNFFDGMVAWQRA